MQSVQSIHAVTGPTLTIAVPAAFEGKQVKVVIEAIESPKLTSEKLLREHIVEKSPESLGFAESWRENPDLLKGSVLRYDDPFEPACPPEDWEESESIFMEKPKMSVEMKRRLAEDPTLMERSVLRYDDPFGPACPPEDWEANS